MLAIISPAKKLKFETRDPSLYTSQPVFPKDTKQLIAVARKLTRADLRQMMKISDNLAELNYQRFQTFSKSPNENETKQAIMAFAGDTYIGLGADTLTRKDLAFAQNNLLILSGLYGLLKPHDLIQPYRLEMGRKLKTKRGETIYAFWGDLIARQLDKQLKGHKHPVLINLASNEYFKAAKTKALKARIINMVFKEQKDGEHKIIGLFVKRARGAMARYMIQNGIETPEDLKKFAQDGYKYRPTMSDDDHWVFTRKQP
ncbi:MAG: peroxide stress protein YaaA [bacterium]|nr:peroxide stress protein YaaA [bacterium]